MLTLAVRQHQALSTLSRVESSMPLWPQTAHQDPYVCEEKRAVAGNAAAESSEGTLGTVSTSARGPQLDVSDAAAGEETLDARDPGSVRRAGRGWRLRKCGDTSRTEDFEAERGWIDETTAFLRGGTPDGRRALCDRIERADGLYVRGRRGGRRILVSYTGHME
ncbi:uncharacterized protein LDX57_005062 [Aspergillus melleus]|uniref:uncharacterized protein n=1 Tax=Aspergillus melleus TaxID=138277 RepID=UPI001E8D9CB0|nr:uncharacterized protein LDX57_005062 [Aspergillus melleus]KAH8427349.1 hypothetical protein LDX57_005062 [Aspergillus melleus]